jgi:23S rRNA pseudouridine2605 synthase
MRLNGHGTLTIEDARTWIEETGLCLFLPKRQFSSSIAPSFVEAVAGHRNATPDSKHIALAEELLVRLEIDGVAVRLNLLGQPGEHPDFVVAAWVLPYVYALRGDRDWRRSPQLTGSRQVSQLAVQAYKLLEAGDTTIPSLKHTLGREVTEGAVLRAITELWQQLRIIPVIAAPGETAKWQLLRTRFQKAIAEGASTSQVTAISVLASIYLQAVIAASMEEVEMFLAPLTARSKVREVLRGLVATRQVHTISLGHAPHFYVAGTLPEFAAAPTAYASSSMPASAYFLHSSDHDDETHDHAVHSPVTTVQAPVQVSAQASVQATAVPVPVKAPESHTPRIPATRKPAPVGKPSTVRPHFSRPAAHSRDRKPAQSSPNSRTARRSGPDTRSSSTRPTAARNGNGSRPASGARWASNGAKNTNGKSNGAHSVSGASNGTRSTGARSNGTHVSGVRTNGNGSARSHSAKVTPGGRNSKPSATSMSQRNGNGHSGKPTGKSSATARSSSLLRSASSKRKDTRPDARPARGNRKPALSAGAKSGNSKRFGFTAPSRPSARPSSKKRG